MIIGIYIITWTTETDFRQHNLMNMVQTCYLAITYEITDNERQFPVEKANDIFLEREFKGKRVGVKTI